MNLNMSPVPLRPVAPVTTASQSPHEDIPGQGWIHLQIPHSAASSHPSQTADGWVVTPDNSPASTCNPAIVIPDTVTFTCDEANLLLNRWRDQVAPLFPFIIVPPSHSAQDLQRDRPFLLRAILCVASHDCCQQLAVGKWIVSQLAERVVVNGERNLDLFLGLLTYSGWFVNQYLYLQHSIPFGFWISMLI